MSVYFIFIFEQVYFKSIKHFVGVFSAVSLNVLMLYTVIFVLYVSCRQLTCTSR